MELFQFGLGGFGGNNLDAQIPDLVVDFRVVDDFTQQVNRGLRRDLSKIFLGGISQVNGALHTVTKAKFLGQFHSQVAGGEHPAAAANLFNDFAAIM